jgi:hypothetical protein
MSGLLFVAQHVIDSWAEQGKIDFVGNVMTMLTGEGRGRSYDLEPAVRFLSLLGADVDPNQLLKKVKSLAHLKEIGAEAIDASVVLGDVAYEVEPGYLAEASALQAAATARPAAPRPPAPAPAATAPPRAPAAAPPATQAPVRPPPGARPPPGVRPPAPAAPPGRATGAPAGPASPADLETRRREAEQLARFLLDNLS